MKKLTLTIGRAAKKLGISIETIRYYERIGLISQPIKPTLGYRTYDKDILARLTFIKRAKTLGFSLNEISELLQLDETKCDETKELAQNKLKNIKVKIADLELISHELEELVVACETNTQPKKCPIVSAISGK